MNQWTLVGYVSFGLYSWNFWISFKGEELEIDNEEDIEA